MQKDSIKREQSQAGLSFAERKNFRPQVKNKLLLLLVLLMTAATGAWATDYTTLAVGDVIKVGDTFSPTADGAFNDNGVASGKTYTLIRADIDNEFNVTEKTDGAYYVFKYVSIMSSPYIHFEKAFVVTAISDGLEVTKIEDMKGMLFYTLALHESSAAATGYTVSMKDGVKDADKWTITPNPAEEGQTVTLQYNGRLKVKGVKATSDAGAPAANIVDLSKLTENTELKDGDVLTGTLGANVKISIADGATVTLDGVTINGVDDANYEWAGITCFGDATIILSGTNTVNGFYGNYPGIQAAAGKTLIINGTGSLTASSLGKGAGIGGANNVACGNIEIQGGTITATSVKYGAGIGGGDRADCGNITISGGTVNATGGERGAGIGGGRRGPDNGSCGNILISGGTVTATGGENAAGIGGGRGYNNTTFSSCGTITITSGVTKVTATMGDGATNSIGAGKFGNCGTVTIGGVEGAITTSPYTYDPTAQAKPAATVTTAPTGAAIVGRLNTNSMALVSGGVADGGTLWYAVTTANTKPTSTAGFSDAVPTAQTITASGKVYVWYYVKGDDTHSDSEISATAIEVPVADVVWDVTNVSNLYADGYGSSYEKEGVTLSSNGDVYAMWVDTGDPTTAGISFEPYDFGGFTFTAPTGKAFTKIEMKAVGDGGWATENLGTGWAFALDMSHTPTVTWTGSAASTVKLLPDTDDFTSSLVKSIVFYLSE